MQRLKESREKAVLGRRSRANFSDRAFGEQRAQGAVEQRSAA